MANAPSPGSAAAPPLPAPAPALPLAAPPANDLQPPANPLHFADPRDIDDFVAGLRRFEDGTMSADEFRTFRLARGTYGQRQPGVNMLRIKIPQGILDGPQLDAVADVAEQLSRGFGHVTTRQNIQLHFVPLARVPEAMERLASVGLTTKEACGNTVRNVTACPLAGVCEGAPFDVTPHAQATTRHFLRNPICQSLPRKLKIAFSGCPDDCALGAINDIGVIAATRAPDGDGNGDGTGTGTGDGDGHGAAGPRQERGFRVRVAGGLSTSPENGHLLYDFLPERELLPVLEAVVRVFDRTGNRQNKSRARLKYVVRRLGWDAFRAEVEGELRALRDAGRGAIAIDAGAATVPHQGPVIPATLLQRSSRARREARPGYFAWRQTNVLRQRQPGLHAAVVRLVRGDVTAAQLRVVARVAAQFSDGTVRTTYDQNLVIRSVAEADLPALHAALEEAGIGRAGARTIADVTSCPGADTCNLAVTHSRELALAIGERLDDAAAAAVQAGKDLDIKISGCPNSCGQHHIAAIGFHGTMRRVGGRAVPEYQLHLGGGIDGERGATFGRHVVKVPARRIPDAVLRLLDLYVAGRAEGEAPLAFFRRIDEAVVREALADLARMDEATARPDDYVDLGQQEQFVVAIGQGECAT